MTRSEFRSFPVVPKSSVRDAANAVVDDLVPGQNLKRVCAGVAVRHHLDHRLALLEEAGVFDWDKARVVERRDSVLGRAAGEELGERDGVFSEVGLPLARPEQSALEVGLPLLAARRGFAVRSSAASREQTDERDDEERSSHVPFDAGSAARGSAHAARRAWLPSAKLVNAISHGS
jgi:hypothetical protein